MIVLHRYANLAEIIGALRATSCFACRLNCRQQERHENADDGNHNQ
jgi:hypothetical protein